MRQQNFTISDLSTLLGLESDGHRAMREAARLGALGPVVTTYARAQYFGPDSTYRASLFMVLHRRIGITAIIAADMLRATQGLNEAAAAVRRGERWRFEIQHVPRNLTPICDFSPWAAPRSGTATVDLPIARTVVDLREIWGWIEPALEGRA